MTSTEFSLSSSLQRELGALGYQPAGPGVWGRIVENFTFFLDVSESETWAWVYAPETGEFLGSKLRVYGAPETAIAMAVEQLDTMWFAHEQSGVGVMGDSPETESVAA